MPHRNLNDGPSVERMTVAECWELLGTRTFGRVCFCVEDRVELVLTAFLTRADTVYFRATAFGPVARLAPSRAVTLQVDDMVDDRQPGWSVTVTGHARRVTDAPTLAELWAPVRLHPWDAGVDPIWMSLSGDDVQGQRGRRRRGLTSAPGSPATP